MGREGLSPDVGGALRLWRTHGRQLLFRAGTTALEGRPALPHGRREGCADAGGARLPCHLLQLGDLGHPGEDRAQAGLSLQAHRAAVRYGQDGAGVLGEAPCATVGVRGETAGAAAAGDEGGEGRDGLLQSRAHEGGADGAVPETARHAVRGHDGGAEIVRDRLRPPARTGCRHRYRRGGAVRLGGEHPLHHGRRRDGQEQLHRRTGRRGDHGEGDGRRPLGGAGGAEPQGACGTAVRHGTERATALQEHGAAAAPCRA